MKLSPTATEVVESILSPIIRSTIDRLIMKYSQWKLEIRIYLVEVVQSLM